MSLNDNSITQLKNSKKSIIFFQNASAARIFKYIGGNSLVYKNYTLEDNGSNSQLYQSNSTLNIKTSKIDIANGNNYITSKGLTGDQGYTVGYPVTKDMSTTGCDPLDAGSAPFGVAISSGQATASFWDDWGNDIFDDWGFFYIFDVATQQYYFPILSPENLDDGIFTTQNFSAFGRTYTITHGYPAEGIFKFEVTCSDDSQFIFGAYGDMGSDGDTINTNLTQAYTLNGQSYTLFYNRNIDDGDNIERFFSYFIPYENSLNNTKTYTDSFSSDDELSLYSVPVRYGVTVYFSKKNDVKDWVINDLQTSSTKVTIGGPLLVKGVSLSSMTLTTMNDSQYNATPGQLINGYLINNNLTDNRTLLIPTASSIISSIEDCTVGTTFRFTVNNVQGGNYSRVLSATDGSIVFTNCATLNIYQNHIITYLGYVSNITSGSEQIQILQETNFITYL